MRRLAATTATLAMILVSVVACANTSTDEQPAQPSSQSGGATSPPTPRVAGIVAKNLAVPWGIGFLPDSSAIVTERDSGRVLRIADGQTRQVGRISSAVPQGEAGLLGVAVSPTFAQDSLLYFYYTSARDNQVASATLVNDRLSAPRPILTGIPAGFIHDGGRMVFGPDGFLYVATGDAADPDSAQDVNSLAGKILRITSAGKPAPGNPVAGSPVWSLGHRNVQGLAFDSANKLWASEFGQDDADELNLIVKGGNYGWPIVEGRGGPERFVQPVLTWPPDDNSPSGLAFADGYLWMASLRGERLWRIAVEGTSATNPTEFFVNEFGRLRTPAADPSGGLWVMTSNRDGRGDPGPDDDRILDVALD